MVGKYTIGSYVLYEGWVITRNEKVEDILSCDQKEDKKDILDNKDSPIRSI